MEIETQALTNCEVAADGKAVSLADYAGKPVREIGMGRTE